MSPVKSASNGAHSPLVSARRVVVKGGSALLVDARSGHLKRAWLEALIEDLLRLRRGGQQLILVSSGPIALGRRHLKLGTGALRLDRSQPARARRQCPPATASQ